MNRHDPWERPSEPAIVKAGRWLKSEPTPSCSTWTGRRSTRSKPQSASGAGGPSRHGLEVATFLPTIHGSRATDTIGCLALPGVDSAAEAKRIKREEIEDLRGVRPIVGASEFTAALPTERWTIVTFLRVAHIKVLVIDEVHNLLSGSHREQRVVLNTLRFLTFGPKISHQMGLPHFPC